ncbi:hypothetical protein R3W88_032367 [Solanum pinnatisectum]|uniref:Chalcone-flavonone isomerase family protein n=1 Tax=Solanum pinnatisectum TaxID=50273 RepID=A0AAV9LNY3_9SOLN|nr:hypothetical protein R3W88_032367 [Solanum pinnatisectum]
MEETQIEREPVKSKGEWVNLFAGSKLAARGMNLQFIAPVVKGGEKIVELQKEEVDKEILKWVNAIVLYVVRDSPTIGALDRFIANQWNFAAKPKIFFPQ